MANYDDLRLSVQAISGGKNDVLFDDQLMPSIMVPINKFQISDVITGGSAATHPAFIVNNTELDKVWVSKFQNIVINNRAYSLPMKDPRVSINFDTAFTYCRNKGGGWCLMPYSVQAAIALWCRKNGTMPRGNNNYGADHSYPHEKGTPASYNGTQVNRTLTGSGPATWSHDWTNEGIADLNGNVWEWNAGMRLNEGEIQIISGSSIFDATISNAADSAAWKAILGSDGSLVAPGTAGTLKYDTTTRKLVTNLTAGTAVNQSGEYTTIGIEGSLTAPEIAEALILYPDDPSGDYGGDYHYWNASGERLPLVGGSWGDTSGAGVFDVGLADVRSYSVTYLGFRAAYAEL